MAVRRLDGLSDEELAKAFADVATSLGEAVNYWMPAVRLTNRLFAIKRVLHARGNQVRLMLAPLLEDKNRFRQYYAARELEGLMPERCRRIIEWNAEQRDAIAGDAGMHLHAVDSGFYKPI